MSREPVAPSGKSAREIPGPGALRVLAEQRCRDEFVSPSPSRTFVHGRRHDRIPVNLPVWLALVDESGDVLDEGEATMADFSPGGSLLTGWKLGLTPLAGLMQLTLALGSSITCI